MSPSRPDLPPWPEFISVFRCNNLLLLKTEMNAGHGGKSGRDGAIEEIALDYAFALKISNQISWKYKINPHISFISRLMGLTLNNLANKGGYNDK